MLDADPVVAARLELERKLLAAGLDDAARLHHVHVVGHDVVEQALVVRHQHDRVVLGGELVDAVGDDPERVDVESGVGLVEDREPGLEQRHLQNLVALLLAAREAFVDAAVEKIRIHFEQLHLLAHEIVELERVELVLAALRLHRVVGESQELAVGDAGNLDGVLKTEEQTGTRTLLGLEFEQVLAFIEDRAASHNVTGMAGKRLGEGALARPVRAHERVHFTASDREVDALEYVDAVHARAQSAHLEQRFAVLLNHPTLPSSLSPSSLVASTANSIGSCWNTVLQNPLMIIDTASSAPMPRCAK